MVIVAEGAFVNQRPLISIPLQPELSHIAVSSTTPTHYWCTCKTQSQPDASTDVRVKTFACGAAVIFTVLLL